MKSRKNNLRLLGLSTERGFTSIEAAVAALVFMIITSSLYMLFTRTQKTFVSQHQLVAAQQNARAALDYITEAISLAGFGIPTPQVYQMIVGATDTLTNNGNKSAFADFGTFSATSTPVDATQIYLKGCFSKVYGSLNTGLTVPNNSDTNFVTQTSTLTIAPLNGSFSVNDNAMIYDTNPGSNVHPFFWVYGTITSLTNNGTTPPTISATIQFTDGTIPGTSPFGTYSFTQGAMIYKIETRAFRLNGNNIEVSDNNNTYETLIDHVSQLAFHYYDNTGTEITPPLSTLAARATIQKVLIQITAQGVNLDMQTKQPLAVTYASTATPRNFQF